MTTSDDSLLVEATGLAKKLCRSIKQSIRHAAVDMSRELIGIRSDRSRLRGGEFWAVRDVSLQLRRGESIAVIGANGAGKTTLLRMLSGLIRPDVGRLAIRGRVAPLIALGAGFSPVLSGRENIRVNLALLGVPVADIQSLEPEVIAFAELDDSIDSPLQTYSSGMYARLAFACAVHANPDVMLLDEVLAVGDLRFRLKCYRRLGALRKQGTAFILVSHQPQTVLSVCERCIYLERGSVKAQGETADVLRQFELDQIGNPMLQEATQSQWRFDHATESGVAIKELVLHAEADAAAQWSTGRRATARIRVNSTRPIEKCLVALAIQDTSLDNERVLHLCSENSGRSFDLPAGESTIELTMPSLGLRSGAYSAKVRLHRGMLDTLDVVENIGFRVESEQSLHESLFHQEHHWHQGTTTEAPTP